MKKIFIVVTIILLFFYCKREPKEKTVVTQEEATSYLKNYLDEKYKEDFVIIEEGRGEVVYEFLVIPQRYKGTYKEKDGYYNQRMHVKLKKYDFGEKILDVEIDRWENIFMREELNDIFLPTLYSIFGKKIRPITIIGADDIKNLNEYFEGGRRTLIGNIFIFGRIDKTDDIKNYEKKIFQFLSSLKEELFFKLDISFFILDERMLAPSYELKIKDQLIQLRKISASAKEFISEREKLMSQLDDEYQKMSDLDKETAMYKLKYYDLIEVYENDYIYFAMLGHSIIHKNIVVRKDLSNSYEKSAYSNINGVRLYNSMEAYYEDRKNQK